MYMQKYYHMTFITYLYILQKMSSDSTKNLLLLQNSVQQNKKCQDLRLGGGAKRGVGRGGVGSNLTSYESQKTSASRQFSRTTRVPYAAITSPKAAPTGGASTKSLGLLGSILLHSGGGGSSEPRCLARHQTAAGSSAHEHNKAQVGRKISLPPKRPLRKN